MDAPSSAVGAALARWRDNLLDLTHHNPLLSLPPTSSWSLTISHPGAGVVMERLLGARKPCSFWLPPATGEEGSAGLGRIQTKAHELVCGDLERADLLAILMRIQQQSESDRTERGLHTLHMVCGLLVWQGEEGPPFRSPILLVPVHLKRSSQVDHFDLVWQGDEPEVNPALRMRLKQEFDFDLPALPGEWNNNTLASFLGEIETTIAGLPGWEVEREVVLAVLPPFKAAMYRDLEENFKHAAAHPLVRALAGETDEAKEEPAPSQAVFHIADANEAQVRCLEAAAGGHSFVLHGPPASGKSQTIANLIADRLAVGKTVLFVSDRLASQKAVFRHLQAAGLSDFCLEMYRHHAEPSGVVAELRRCLEFSPQADGELAVDEVERLQQRHIELNAFLQALQTVREPLRQSAAWALGELARCDGLPRMPLGLSDAADFTAEWMGQAQAAVQRLQKLWHIHEEGPDYAWWGFKADGRYTQKVRDEVNSLLERARGRMDRLAATARDYGAKIGAVGPVSWLLRVADALEASPAPPVSWLTTEDLSQVGADLERCAATDQQPDQTRAPLTARYAAEIWRLPTGTRARVEEAWHAVAPLLAPGDERGEGLLSHQQQLRGWAADTQRRIPGWISEARTLEKWLGVSLPLGAGAVKRAGQEDPSVQDLKRLHRLANLCVADNAPERSWVLDGGALEHARKIVDSNRPAFAAINQSRAALLERYNEQLFDLDLVGIADRLAGSYRSWLRGFNLQFRRDRRAVGRRCRTETLPSTWWQDVATAGDLMRQKGALDAEQPARQAVLGRYEKSLATDFDAAERATRVAAEAVELARELGCSSLPGKLVDALATTAPPSEKIRAALKRLHDSLGAWQHATDALKAYLPMNHLPGAGVPLEEAALSLLNDYARDLQATLNPFAAAVDPVIAHAKPTPVDAVTLLADLRQVEELSASQETREQANAQWTARLGGVFKDAATDWKTLRKMLGWAVRLRELFQVRGNGAALASLPEQVVKAAGRGASAAPSSRELRQAKEQLEQSLHALENRFEPPGPLWQGKRFADHSLDELATRIDTLHKRVGELADWIEWRHLPQRFAQLGLTDFWEGLQKERPPANRLADVFTKAALESWLESVFKNDPVLARFKHQEHEGLVGEHREVSGRLMRHNARHVARLLAARRPQASEFPGVETIAQGLEAAPELILRTKPCFFMSPRSVSRFLPCGKVTFDLVVFDDASEIQREDALPALYRAKQAVIAGDNEQPDPAHFAQWEPDVSASDVPVVESLLSACLRAGMPQYALHEQYGGEPERLLKPDRRYQPEAPAKDPSLALQAGEPATA